MTKRILAIGLIVFLALSSLFFGDFALAYHSGSDSNNEDQTAEEELENEEDEEEELEDEDEDEDDEVEDITDIELRDIPFRFGKFELGGTVTATDTTASTITVNGLEVNVAGARIHRGKDTALTSVVVGDRVRMSGKIEDGALKAERVAVVESSSSGRGGSKLLEALRAEIREQIRAILEQIDDLREQLQAQQGES